MEVTKCLKPSDSESRNTDCGNETPFPRLASRRQGMEDAAREWVAAKTQFAIIFEDRLFAA